MILLRPPLKALSNITGPKRGLHRVAKTSLEVWLPTGLGFKEVGEAVVTSSGLPHQPLCPVCPQHSRNTAPEPPGAGAMVHQSTSICLDVGTQPALGHFPALS